MSKRLKVPSLRLSEDSVTRLIDLGTLTAEDFAPAPLADREDFIPHAKSMGYWQDAWRRLRRNRVSMVALVIILLIAVFAFAGPRFVPYKYQEQYRTSLNLAPMQYSESEQARLDAGEKVFPHVFGTDTHGRDIMARTMVGARVSIAIGVLAALMVLIIGSIYGAVSGLIGGLTDSVMMRILEIIASIPDVLVVLLLSVSIKPRLESFVNSFGASNKNAFARGLSVLGPSITAIFICFALLYWITMARIIRGQVLQLKNQEFVTAARALGASQWRIIRRHLLPNCIGSMIAATCLQIPSAIFLESFLSFLGVGVQAPLTSLGSMCSDALGGMYTYTYRLIIPAAILLVLLLSFNLFGDGLRDALDPRLKK